MQQRDSLFLSPSCRKGERYELCTTDCLFSAGIFPFGQGGGLVRGRGASGLARKLGIPQLVIGLTIVAMGTSLPEAAVSISAALRGNAEITIGNIVGSNILNILIILGVTALIATLKVADSTVRYEIPFMIVATFVLLWLGYTGGQVTWLEGVILWVLLPPLSALSLHDGKKGQGRRKGSGAAFHGKDHRSDLGGCRHDCGRK